MTSASGSGGSPTPSGTTCWTRSAPSLAGPRPCWTVSCRPRSPGTLLRLAWTCFPARARSGPAAPAPTTPTRASTRRRSATWSRTRWTRIRSRSCCCEAVPGARCSPDCGPAAAAWLPPGPAPQARAVPEPWRGHQMAGRQVVHRMVPATRPLTRAWMRGRAALRGHARPGPRPAAAGRPARASGGAPDGPARLARRAP